MRLHNIIILELNKYVPIYSICYECYIIVAIIFKSMLHFNKKKYFNVKVSYTLDHILSIVKRGA